MVLWAKTARPSKRSSNFYSLIHRATGCVEIRSKKLSLWQTSIVYLLYTINPSHDLLRDITSEDHIDSSTSITMECLLTMMETVSEDVYPFLGYFGSLLRDTSPFATYYNLFRPEIIDMYDCGIAEQVPHISVPCDGCEDLDQAIDEGSLDRDPLSPHYGLARWQLKSPAQLLVIGLDRTVGFLPASLVSTLFTRNQHWKPSPNHCPH